MCSTSNLADLFGAHWSGCYVNLQSASCNCRELTAPQTCKHSECSSLALLGERSDGVSSIVNNREATLVTILCNRVTLSCLSSRNFTNGCLDLPDKVMTNVYVCLPNSLNYTLRSSLPHPLQEVSGMQADKNFEMPFSNRSWQFRLSRLHHILVRRGGLTKSYWICCPLKEASRLWDFDFWLASIDHWSNMLSCN